MEMAPPSLPHHADSCSRLSSRTGGVPDPIINSFISLTGNRARSVMECERGFENPANFTRPGRAIQEGAKVHADPSESEGEPPPRGAANPVPDPRRPVPRLEGDAPRSAPAGHAGGGGRPRIPGRRVRQLRLLCVRRPHRQARLGVPDHRRRPDRGRGADGYVVVQYRELRAGGAHRRGQAGLEEVARRPADEHARRGGGPHLHGLPRQPGRPPALPGVLRPARRARRCWKGPIEGEIITAPVLAEGHVHFATLDGTLCRVRQDDGHVEWKEPRNATSSPVVWEGRMLLQPAARRSSGATRREGPLPDRDPRGAVARPKHDARPTGRRRGRPTTSTTPSGWRGRRGYAASRAVDAAVGFAAPRATPKMHQAMKQPGHGARPRDLGLSGLQAVRLSGPALSRPTAIPSAAPIPARIRSSGSRALGPKAGRQARAAGQPPDAAGDRQRQALLRDGRGRAPLPGRRIRRGALERHVGEPIVFQPAVAGGRVYVGHRRRAA